MSNRGDPPSEPVAEPQPGAVLQRDLFSRRTLRFLLILVPLSFAITLIFSLLAPATSSRGAEFGSNSFSVSAIGYQALAELLADAGVPTLSSQYSSGQRASPKRPLVLLGPPGDEDGISRLRQMLEHADNRDAPIIIVLPKWEGTSHSQRGGWVGKVTLVPEHWSAAVLAAGFGMGSEARPIVRLEQAPVRWSTTLDIIAPTLPAPQLVRPGQSLLNPILWCDQGTLVGRIRSDTLLIADPDLLNTAGIALPGNAELAYELLVNHFDAEALVVDETLRGFSRTPSRWRELLRFP